MPSSTTPLSSNLTDFHLSPLARLQSRDIDLDGHNNPPYIAMDANRSGDQAKRVLIAVSRRSPHWDKAWDSSEELIAIALNLMQEKHFVSPDVRNESHAITFLVTERWDLRTYIVFDILHDTYDPGTAHLSGGTELPVILVSLSEKESVATAGRIVANKVNHDIRDVHNLTGLGSIPPFFVDHADGKFPIYLNPRNLRVSSV